MSVLARPSFYLMVLGVIVVVVGVTLYEVHRRRPARSRETWGLVIGAGLILFVVGLLFFALSPY